MEVWLLTLSQCTTTVTKNYLLCSVQSFSCSESLKVELITSIGLSKPYIKLSPRPYIRSGQEYYKLRIFTVITFRLTKRSWSNSLINSETDLKPFAKSYLSSCCPKTIQQYSLKQRLLCCYF